MLTSAMRCIMWGGTCPNLRSAEWACERCRAVLYCSVFCRADHRLTHSCTSDDAVRVARASAAAAAASAAASRAAASSAALVGFVPANYMAMFARISASRGSPRGPLCAFAGGSLPTTILSSCADMLLSLLSSRDVLPLRAACREGAVTVARYPFEDSATLIRGSVRCWRACFPHALAANFFNISFASQPWLQPKLCDADFAHLTGVRALNISGQQSLTDAAFVALARSYPTPGSPTSIIMSGCNAAGLGISTFECFRGLQYLDISYCHNWRSSFRDDAFFYLRNIRTLDMSQCPRKISDSAFWYLKSIRALKMNGCSQDGITDAAFRHVSMRGLCTLEMKGCHQVGITASALRLLPEIQVLK
jgi:hypothetical protein